jgi:hypothetical protein
MLDQERPAQLSWYCEWAVALVSIQTRNDHAGSWLSTWQAGGCVDSRVLKYTAGSGAHNSCWHVEPTAVWQLPERCTRSNRSLSTPHCHLNIRALLLLLLPLQLQALCLSASSTTRTGMRPGQLTRCLWRATAPSLLAGRWQLRFCQRIRCVNIGDKASIS